MLAIRGQNHVANIYGTAGNDGLNGTTSNDSIYGYAGNDIISGNSGIDNIYGGFGNDSVFGDAGNDIIWYQNGDGRDSVVGGSGSDTFRVYSTGSETTVSVYLSLVEQLETFNINTTKSVRIYATSGNSVDVDSFLSLSSSGGSYEGIFGDSGANTASGFDINSSPAYDKMWGGAGNDTFWGNAGNDGLYGEADNDTLRGGSGDDIINGGNGDDIIYGDSGNDSLNGWLGSDRICFDLSAPGSSGSDSVHYFDDGLDKIQIDTPTGLSIADLTIAASGANTTISYNGNVITLTSFDVSLIDAGDFIFA